MDKLLSKIPIFFSLLFSVLRQYIYIYIYFFLWLKFFRSKVPKSFANLLALDSVMSPQFLNLLQTLHRKTEKALFLAPFFVPKCHMTVSNIHQISYVDDGQRRWWSSRIPNEKRKKLFTSHSVYLYILLWISSQKQPRNKYLNVYIWERICGNTTRGVGKWNQEEKKQIKSASSSNLWCGLK